MKEEPKMNYCCDCGWAVKKGLFFKTWYCTCPQKNEVFGSHVFHPVTCKPMIKTPIACDVARFVGKEGAAEQHAVNLKHPCPNYKGELRHHPAIPPMKCPLPCPPLPERVEKAMEKEKLQKFDPMIDEDSLPPEVWTKAVCDDKSCIHRAGLGCDRKWIFITEGGNCGKRMTMDEYQKYMGFKVEEEKGEKK